MSGRRRLVVATLLGLTVAVGAGGSPAGAQERSCWREAEGPGTEGPVEPTGVNIDIDTPLPGDRITGESEVRGTVRSAVPVSRVELVSAGAVLDHQDFPSTTHVPFTLRWHARRANVGQNTLRVVTCGALAQGDSSVQVQVPPRRPLWVGLAFGSAGLVGLFVSRAFPRRENRRASVANGAEERGATGHRGAGSRP